MNGKKYAIGVMTVLAEVTHFLSRQLRARQFAAIVGTLVVMTSWLFTTADTALAQTVVWDGSTDTDWSVDPDATSWGGGADTTFNDGDAAQFNGAGAGTVNITGNVSPSSVSVTSGSYTFDDGGGSIAGGGTLSKSGSGTLTIFSANTFTGGIDLSGGRIDIRNNANEASFLGDSGNTLTFTADARLHNNNGTATLPQNVTINGGVQADITGAFGERTQVTGVLAGSGTLYIQGLSAGYDAEFLNTGNTFTGPIQVHSGDSVTLGMRSLADSPGPTTIGLDSQSNNGAKFEYMSGAIAPLVLNNRQFELLVNGSAGSNLGRQPGIVNNAATANTITINTDLLITGTGSKKFLLMGGNTGDNTFAGDIPDAIGVDVLHLYKQNSGKWILSGTNTYAGNTDITGGTLEVADGGSLLFIIGASGVNNQITGSTTVELNGAFDFDLTGAGTSDGDSWTIVDTSGGLTANYGAAFTVKGFTDAGGGLWETTSGGNTYKFDEDTGNLTYIPPPTGTLVTVR